MKIICQPYQLPEIQRFLVDDGPMCGSAVKIYLFSANIYDVLSIPSLPWTVVHISHAPVQDDNGPAIWRMGMKNPGRVIELESVSDANTRTMREEAEASWCAFRQELAKRSGWMSLIGCHMDIISRMITPKLAHAVRVASMAPDFLERLYAEGNAEMARIAHLLNEFRKKPGESELGRAPMTEIFWPEVQDEITDPDLRQRYERASKGRFPVVSESIYAPE
jgi:hypothetical protein